MWPGRCSPTSQRDRASASFRRHRRGRTPPGGWLQPPPLPPRYWPPCAQHTYRRRALRTSACGSRPRRAKDRHFKVPLTGREFEAYRWVMPFGEGERYGSLLMGADHLPRLAWPSVSSDPPATTGRRDVGPTPRRGRPGVGLGPRRASPAHDGPGRRAADGTRPGRGPSGSRTLACSLAGSRVRTRPLVAAGRSNRLLRLRRRTQPRSGHPSGLRQAGGASVPDATPPAGSSTSCSTE